MGLFCFLVKKAPLFCERLLLRSKNPYPDCSEQISPIEGVLHGVNTALDYHRVNSFFRRSHQRAWRIVLLGHGQVLFLSKAILQTESVDSLGMLVVILVVSS